MSILIHDFKHGWQNAADQNKMRADALFKLLDIETDDVGSLRCRHLLEEHPFFATQTITSEIDNVYKVNIEGTGVYLMYYTYSTNLYRHKSNTKATTLLSAAMTGDHVSFAALRPNLATKTHIYLTDGVTMAADDGTSYKTWGLDAPTSSLYGSAVGSGGDLSAGDYVYAYTFYDGDTGIESDASPNSGVVSVVADDSVNLTNIEVSSDSRVTARRIYRTKVNGGTKYLVKVLPDNSATTNTDTTADTSLTSSLNTDQGTPPTIDCVEAFRSRLWMCGDANYPFRVWYSDNERPDNVATTNYLELEHRFGKVMNLAVMHGILYFVQATGISRLYGETTDVFTPGETNSHVGVYGRWTVATGPDGIYFLGNDGVYKFNGLQSIRVSDAIDRSFGKIVGSFVDVVDWGLAANASSACFVNGKYWLQIPMKGTTGASANKLMVLDVMHAAENQIWELHNVPTTCLFGEKTDGEVYGGRAKLSGGDYSLYKVNHTTRNADDTPTPTVVTRGYRLGKPLSWAEDKKGHLVSVEEPALDFIKEYRIDADGTWTITFYVDGVNRYSLQHTGLSEANRTTWHKVDPKIKGGFCYIKLVASTTLQPATCKLREVEVR